MIRKEFFETPDMVCEICCHRRSSLLPFAPRRSLWNGDAQRLMRAYEIEDRILKREMAPQEDLFFACDNVLRTKRPILWREVRLSRVDLLATKHLGDDVASTEDDASADLDHASLLAPFIHLSI